MIKTAVPTNGECRALRLTKINAIAIKEEDVKRISFLRSRKLVCVNIDSLELISSVLTYARMSIFREVSYLNAANFQRDYFGISDQS